MRKNEIYERDFIDGIDGINADADIDIMFLEGTYQLGTNRTDQHLSITERTGR